jgi:hypothetical protein
MARTERDTKRQFPAVICRARGKRLARFAQAATSTSKASPVTP